MRVEAVAIGELEAFEQRPEFRTQARGAAHCTIHVQPQLFFLANSPDFFQRVKSIRGGGAQGRGDKERNKASLAVLRDLFREELGTHPEVRVDLNQFKLSTANTGNFDGLLDRRMRLGRGVGNETSITRQTLCHRGVLMGFDRSKYYATDDSVFHQVERQVGTHAYRQVASIVRKANRWQTILQSFQHVQSVCLKNSGSAIHSLNSQLPAVR
jgi:hypothetical protein